MLNENMNFIFFILGGAQIDNFPFRLHYRFTSGFLFMATAILALNDMFGKVCVLCCGVHDAHLDVAGHPVPPPVGEEYKSGHHPVLLGHRNIHCARKVGRRLGI